MSSAWGILVFREIKVIFFLVFFLKNYEYSSFPFLLSVQGVFSIVIYFVAFGISICGLIMNGLSRTTVHCH